MKREKNKRYFRFGLVLFYLIPIWIILIVWLMITLFTGSLWGFLFTFLLLFFGTTLHVRWVLYFAENYYCTFYFMEGKKKIFYNTIEKIYRDDAFAASSPNALKVYLKKKNKLKMAKFEVSSYEYMANVLNFLKDKIDTDVINEDSFKEIGIEYEDGEYKYLAPVSRQYIKRKTEKEL